MQTPTETAKPEQPTGFEDSPQAKPARLAVPPKEAFELLSLGKDAGYEAIRTGQIPSIRIGRRILVPLAALEKMLAAATRAA